MIRSVNLMPIVNNLKRNGQNYNIYRKNKNSFGETTDEVLYKTILGLFHTSSDFVGYTEGQQGKPTIRKTPMILCLYADGNDIMQEDVILINGKRYKAINSNNIYENNLVCDISLEQL